MRSIAFFLALGLAGCVATRTSPVLRELRDQSLAVLRHCDARGGWEVDSPSAPPSVSSYRLPKTQLLTFGCNVRDLDSFFDRAELEFAHFLRKHGALGVGLVREETRGTHELSWTYHAAGREGVVTLWATPESDGLRRIAITIHESRAQR